MMVFDDRPRRLPLLSLLLLLLLAGCGGNSANSDAPSAVAAHTATWVTYHRSPMYEGFSRKSSEALTECRVCHGANLLGASDGMTAPACLDCHVLDPSRYPVLCYSCHGGRPNAVIPFDQWLAANAASRAGRPIDPQFIVAVRTSGIHLKHDAIPLVDRDSEDKCRYCHDGSPAVPDRHHGLGITCLDFMGGCHPSTYDPNVGFTVEIVRDCTVCHTGLP